RAGAIPGHPAPTRSIDKLARHDALPILGIGGVGGAGGAGGDALAFNLLGFTSEEHTTGLQSHPVMAGGVCGGDTTG
ncbi:hypothetical protein PJI75_29790, partial [Mycobacterium kansasii]